MIAGDEDRAQVLACLEPILAEISLTLFDLRLVRRGKSWLVEAFVDHADGGVTIDECAAVNRRLWKAMDEASLFSGEFEVVVASPGLDWPLSRKVDFLRVRDQEVQLWLREPVAGKKEWIGRVSRVNDDGVEVMVNDESIIISLVNIQKAVQVI